MIGPLHGILLTKMATVVNNNGPAIRALFVRMYLVPVNIREQCGPSKIPT